MTKGKGVCYRNMLLCNVGSEAAESQVFHDRQPILIACEPGLMPVNQPPCHGQFIQAAINLVLVNSLGNCSCVALPPASLQSCASLRPRHTAFHLVINSANAENAVRNALKEPVTYANYRELVQKAVESGVITEEQATMVRLAQEASQAVIEVDDFPI